VRDKWAEQPAEEFETIWEIRTWAGVVAKNHIIDRQRHRGVEFRVEKLADLVAPMFHAAMPFPPASTPIQLRDVLKQALIIAVNLASRKPARKTRRRPERRTNLLIVQFWVQFLASMFGCPLGSASELAAMLETTRGTVYTNRVKIQRRVMELQRAGKIDLDLPSGRSKPQSKSKREPRT
jgi:DNA-directed RNA polymerase specialized sigma24 family protein